MIHNLIMNKKYLIVILIFLSINLVLASKCPTGVYPCNENVQFNNPVNQGSSLTINNINTSLNGSFWTTDSSQNSLTGTKSGSYNINTSGYIKTDTFYPFSNGYNYEFNYYDTGWKTFWLDLSNNAFSSDTDFGDVLDLGTSTYKWRDLYISRTALINNIIINGTSGNVSGINNICYSNGTNCQSNFTNNNVSTNGSLLISRNNSLNPNVVIEMSNIGTDWNYKPALRLVNPTLANSGITRQMPPSIEFSGQEWVSGASQEQSARITCRGGSGENDIYCGFMMKKGAGSWTNAFTVLSDGAITSSNSMYTYGIAENIKPQFRFYNGKSSTAGTDEYSPMFQFYGTGWNGTASKVMSTGFLEAPESHTGKDSNGVFKFIHGNNLWVGSAWNVSETNETLRLLHGDTWGAEFNHYTIANYTVNITGLLQLQVYALPSCGSAVNGTFGRNETGIYLCNTTGQWSKLG